MCKFTPLGFETIDRADRALVSILGVNLPRWGLKLRLEATNVRAIGACVNLRYYVATAQDFHSKIR